MLHITCDLCGKELRGGEDHYVVKIEVFATHDPAQLTEADLDEDHMEAVSELLREVEEEGSEGEELEPASRRMRYDLCPDCRQRYLRDPLRKEPAGKFDFSEN
jgi:hypothetical protein